MAEKLRSFRAVSRRAVNERNPGIGLPNKFCELPTNVAMWLNYESWWFCASASTGKEST